MEIPFTKEQYRALLKVVYLGEWIANARQSASAPNDVSRIEQYIYSFAERFGAEELVQAEGKTYHPSRDLDDIAIPVIEEYDEEGFWDKLIDLLAARDLELEHGREGVDRLGREEFLEQLDERASVYEEEFEEFGVDRLQIVEE